MKTGIIVCYPSPALPGTLSPSDGERAGVRGSRRTVSALACTLSPSDGERAGVRGFVAFADSLWQLV